MSNIFRKTKAGTQVSSWQQSSNTVTPNQQTSFILPHGLTLQQKVGQSNITNVTASGGVVTYTAANNYSAGDTVGVYDVNPTAYNLRLVTVRSATSTQFTVTNAATGTYVSGGIVQKTGFMSVTIPAGITWVYAIAVGGGGSGQNGGGGGGGLSWGWTLASSTCIIGKQDTYTRYGHIIAGNGGNGNNAFGILGGGSGRGATTGSINYWGMPAGGNGTISMGAGGGGGDTSTPPAKGGNGISGGGGGYTNTANVNGANGGSGVIGGGGGGGVAVPGGTGGNGGSGINILTGEFITGGTGQAIGGDRTAPGGGAGCVTKGLDAVSGTGGNGGLGGGGGAGAGYTPAAAAGDGILYLFY